MVKNLTAAIAASIVPNVALAAGYVESSDAEIAFSALVGGVVLGGFLGFMTRSVGTTVLGTFAGALIVVWFMAM